MFELAQRNGVLHTLPCKTLDEMRAAYNFQDLQSFLDLYYAGCAALICEQVCAYPLPGKAGASAIPQNCSMLYRHLLLVAFMAPWILCSTLCTASQCLGWRTHWSQGTPLLDTQNSLWRDMTLHRTAQEVSAVSALMCGCLSCVSSLQDFYDLSMAYFRKAKADNIVHAEIFFDPQTHTMRGVPLSQVFQGIARAQKEAEQSLGISSGLIMCFLRDQGPEKAMQTLAEVGDLQAPEGSALTLSTLGYRRIAQCNQGRILGQNLSTRHRQEICCLGPQDQCVQLLSEEQLLL